MEDWNTILFKEGFQSVGTKKPPLCSAVVESLSAYYTANGNKCLWSTLLRSHITAFQAPGKSFVGGQAGNCILQPSYSLKGSVAWSKLMVVAKLGIRKSSTAWL